MRQTETTPARLLLDSLKLVLLVSGFVYALIVNGAIPGLFTPTLGQAVWLTGFAASFAESGAGSIFAQHLGIPEPAAIALGLPMAIVAALALKAGAPPPDAYALACLVWLAVGFWGAWSLCRLLGTNGIYATFGATIWLTFPVIWQHADYSAVSIGIALLPAYYYSALRVIQGDGFHLPRYLLFLFFAVTASFMDGYTFIMFASASLATLAKVLVLDKDKPRFRRTALLISAGFVVSAVLYSSYSSSAEFKYPVDFFRGWGVDLTFIAVPTQGILWVFDWLGMSAARSQQMYFGDASVYISTFSIFPIFFALVFFLSNYGNKKYKYLFFGIGIIALYLALGPSFKFNSLRIEGTSPLMPPEYAVAPTGTAILWKKVPGLYNMRAVYRWTALAIMAFWAVAMIGLADRRLPRMAAILILSLLAVANLPHFGNLTDRYAANRTAFIQLDTDLQRVMKPVLNPGETVAFLPTGNDFLVNFLAPRLGIRSFNIGGDKNAAVARRYWPKEMRDAADARTPDAFALGVVNVLIGTADAVAVPYIDLLWSAHIWPYPRNRFEPMQANISTLRGLGTVDIVETEYFAVVRLKPELAAMPADARRMLISADECPSGPQGTPRVRLTAGAPLSFSDRNNLCGEGWSHVEAWGRWTDGGHAGLNYELAKPADGQVLEFASRAYVAGSPPTQRVGVRINGRDAPEWVFTPDNARQITHIAIPDGATEIRVEFAFSDARSPKQAGQSEDARVLGIGVSAVCLTPAGKACLTQ